MAVVKSITVKGGLVTAGSGGTVDTADITADAVTFAVMQNVTAPVLLGRSTAGAGDIETITVGTGLSLSAGTLTATGGAGITPQALEAWSWMGF